MYGAVVMSILILIFTALQAVPATSSIQWAGISIIIVFLFVFGYAWQRGVWLYCSEIAPLEYRHIGGAFTGFGEWLITLIPFRGAYRHLERGMEVLGLGPERESRGRRVCLLPLPGRR